MSSSGPKSDIIVTRPGSVRLRRWRPGDAASLVENANNVRVWENLRDAFPYPYMQSDAVAWIKRPGSETPQTNFAVEVDGKAVGGIGIALQQDVYRLSAEIGYWLGEPYWRQGIMTEAVKAVTEYAFANFNICRLYAHVYEWNHGSRHVLEKAGFRLEGTLRKSVIKMGKIGDQFIYAIVRQL